MMIIIGIEYEYGYEVLFEVIKCGKVVSYISENKILLLFVCKQCFSVLFYNCS